jgi:hypothetical protein
MLKYNIMRSFSFVSYKNILKKIEAGNWFFICRNYPFIRVYVTHVVDKVSLNKPVLKQITEIYSFNHTCIQILRN